MSKAKLAESGRRRIYLMRHGDVTYFDGEGRPFRPDTVPLNERGQMQAKAAGDCLAEVVFDRIVASDLLRCQQTAKLVVGERTTSIEAHPDIREIQPGKLADFAHLPREEIEREFVGAFVDAPDRDKKFLGGESFGSMLDRVLPFISKQLDRDDWSTMLMVAHGGVNRAILSHALGTGLASFGAIEQDTACINILDIDRKGRWLVRLINHSPYNVTKHDMVLTTMEHLFEQFLGQGGPS